MSGLDELAYWGLMGLMAFVILKAVVILGDKYGYKDR